MAKRLNWNAIVRIGFTAVCAVVTGFVCPELESREPDPPAQAVQDDIHEWIVDLGHDSYAVRETAAKRLTAAGVRAVRAVAAAVASRDLEVAYRAQAILTKIAQVDGASMEVLLELEHAGSRRVTRSVRRILKLPAVRRQFKLFKRMKKEQAHTVLSRARRDVMLGRTDSAWRRVCQFQALDERFGLFGKPNPILAVIACLEVEAAVIWIPDD